MKRLTLAALALFVLSIAPQPAEAGCQPLRTVLRGAGRVVSAPFRAVRANRSARRAGNNCG